MLKAIEGWMLTKHARDYGASDSQDEELGIVFTIDEAKKMLEKIASPLDTTCSPFEYGRSSYISPDCISIDYTPCHKEKLPTIWVSAKKVNIAIEMKG